MRAGRLPQHLRQPGAVATGWSPPRVRSGLPLFLGAYPITPASDILHELQQAQAVRRDDVPGRGRDRRHRRRARCRVRRVARRHHHVRARASRSRARPSAWRSRSSCRSIVVDVQRGGPSTGLPTKTEQSDLLQAMFGRNGEAPMPIVAPQSPGDCFDAAIEARASRSPTAPGDACCPTATSPTAPSRGSFPTSTRCRQLDADVRHRAQPRDRDRRPRVLAVPARPRDPGPAVGDPRHARPRAPRRRPREGRRPRQHLLRPRPTTT